MSKLSKKIFDFIIPPGQLRHILFKNFLFKKIIEVISDKEFLLQNCVYKICEQIIIYFVEYYELTV